MKAICSKGHNYERTPDEFKANPQCPKCKKQEKLISSPAAEKRQLLLELAKAGRKRPNKESRNIEEKNLGSALGYYLTDPDFKRLIIQIAPQWLIRRTKK